MKKNNNKKILIIVIAAVVFMSLGRMALVSRITKVQAKTLSEFERAYEAVEAMDQTQNMVRNEVTGNNGSKKGAPEGFDPFDYITLSYEKDGVGGRAVADIKNDPYGVMEEAAIWIDQDGDIKNGDTVTVCVNYYAEGNKVATASREYVLKGLPFGAKFREK